MIKSRIPETIASAQQSKYCGPGIRAIMKITAFLLVCFAAFLSVGCSTEPPNLKELRLQISDLKQQVAGVKENLRGVERQLANLEQASEALKRENSEIKQQLQQTASSTGISNTTNAPQVESRPSVPKRITKREACARLQDLIRPMAAARSSSESRDRGIKFHELLTEVIALHDSVKRSIYDASGRWDEDMNALHHAITDFVANTRTTSQNATSAQLTNAINRLDRFCH